MHNSVGPMNRQGQGQGQGQGEGLGRSSLNHPPPPPPSAQPLQVQPHRGNGGPLHPGYGPGASGTTIPNHGSQMGGGHGHGGSQGQQQQQPQLMARPPMVPGVPPGLEYLTQIDQLLVHQQVEVFEVLTGVETCNRYIVKNTLGQQVYFAGEESGLFMRTCCGAQRSFVMHIVDNYGQEVIRVNREFKCVAGCNCFAFCGACSMEVEVEAPVGQIIGRVRQVASCMAPKFAITDSQDQTVLILEGPSCACTCCAADQDFRILAPGSNNEVGVISKQWSGFLKEYFTDADNFGITFPMNLDTKVKATLLGSVFLIDYMFFENNQGQN